MKKCKKITNLLWRLFVCFFKTSLFILASRKDLRDKKDIKWIRKTIDDDDILDCFLKNEIDPHYFAAAQPIFAIKVNLFV
jgi:hypothetical protein